MKQYELKTRSQTEKPVYKLGTSGKHDRDIKMIAKLFSMKLFFFYIDFNFEIRSNPYVISFLCKYLLLKLTSYRDNAIRSPSKTSPSVKLLCSTCKRH